MNRQNDQPEIIKSQIDCQNSVSYTHLLAHETVLDLVCRLLLEKKKNHKLDNPSAKRPRGREQQQVTTYSIPRG